MYTIEYRSSAAKELAKLEMRERKRIIAAIDDLARSPLPVGVTKMHGPDVSYRIRVGEFRVIYEVHHDVLIVLVLKIADRKEVYK